MWTRFVCIVDDKFGQLKYAIPMVTFFLTHGDERAPAAATSEEEEESTRALRWIDPQTRSTDLDVLVYIYIAADRIPQIKLCSGV